MTRASGPAQARGRSGDAAHTFSFFSLLIHTQNPPQAEKYHFFVLANHSLRVHPGWSLVTVKDRCMALSATRLGWHTLRVRKVFILGGGSTLRCTLVWVAAAPTRNQVHTMSFTLRCTLVHFGLCAHMLLRFSIIVCEYTQQWKWWLVMSLQIWVGALWVVCTFGRVHFDWDVRLVRCTFGWNARK